MSAALASTASPRAAVADTASLHDGLAHAFTLYDHQQVAAARAEFAALLARALDEGDGWAAAEAHRGLGRTFYFSAEYARARDELDLAMEGFLLLDDRLGVARVSSHLGSLALMLGDREDAVALYTLALGELEPMGPLREQAELLFNLALTSTSNPQKRRYLGQGAEVARGLGSTALEGAFLNSRGDLDYSEGRYQAAQGHLEQAVALLEEADAPGDLARALNSLARLQRAQGQLESAMDISRRALGIQEELGDIEGTIQTLDHLADALGAAGEHRQALVLYDRAAALARRTGSPRRIAYVKGRTAEAHLRKGDAAKAAALLEEVLASSRAPDFDTMWRRHLSEAYARLGRFGAALDEARRAVDGARPTSRLNLLLPALHARARALAGLGRVAEAQADVREQMEIVERVRHDLAGRDFLKRGYAQQSQRAFAQAVDVLYRSGRAEEALEAAERARARAFLDLLAGREALLPPEPAGGSFEPKPREPDLASPAETRAATVGDIAEVARRLESTVLAYFVTEDATFAWVIGARGLVRCARIAIREQDLADRVARVGGAPGPSNARPARARRVLMAARGGGFLFGGSQARAGLRELYEILIAPVRPHLPRHGGRLMVIPHGPLVRLPFGALPDARGTYLLESATLYYAPAAAALSVDGREAAPPRPESRLLVADPQAFPIVRGLPALPPLPGTRREVRMSASAGGPGDVTVLVGTAATEANVRRTAAEATVVHFATHGVVRDDEPFESFLALRPGGGGTDDDGRLTATEVYGLALRARLVVLSACRTARGPLSPDGIAGLTRAFFAAGAESVVATLWDVPDDPTFRLMAAFHAGLSRSRDRALALRTAQLGVLRALRKGRILARTPAGRVPLPEHPALWAAFVLIGKP